MNRHNDSPALRPAPVPGGSRREDAEAGTSPTDDVWTRIARAPSRATLDRRREITRTRQAAERAATRIVATTAIDTRERAPRRAPMRPRRATSRDDDADGAQ